MLSKRYRLPTSFFKEIVRERKKPAETLSNTLFLAKIYTSPNNYSRFEVVVSSANFKKATERNCLRRTVYEILRKDGFYKKPNQDIVLIIKPEISRTSPEEIKDELFKFFRN